MGDVFTGDDALNLLASSPAEVSALAGVFRLVATQSEHAIQALNGANGDLHWTGAAADAFRKQLGKLPSDLGKINQSYGEVAGALDTYEAALAQVRSTFQSLYQEYESLQSQLGTAQTNLTSANTNLTSTHKANPKAPASDPTVSGAKTAVTSAKNAVSGLQGQISTIESAAQTVLDHFDSARGTAKSKVSSAKGVAPTHHWWQSALADFDSVVKDVGKTAWGLVKDVGKAAAALPGDVANVVTHPTNLEDWAKLGEDAGTVAGAVALVASVAVFPADALGADALVEGIEGVGTVAEGVGTGAGLMKTDADIGLAADGKKSWGTVGFDVVGDAVGQAKIPGLGDAKTEATNLEGKATALTDFQTNVRGGMSPADARSALNDGDKRFLTSSTKKLSNPARVEYMKSTTEASLKTAKSTERKLDFGNEAVHTGYEKGADKLKEKVVPEPADGGDTGGDTGAG